MEPIETHSIEFPPGTLGFKLSWFPYLEGAIGIMRLTNETAENHHLFQPELIEITNAHIAIVKAVGAGLPQTPDGELRPLDIIVDFGKFSLRTIPANEDARRPRPIEAENGLVLVGYEAILQPGAILAILRVLTRISSSTSRMNPHADFDSALESAKERIAEILSSKRELLTA